MKVKNKFITLLSCLPIRQKAIATHSLMLKLFGGPNSLLDQVSSRLLWIYCIVVSTLLSTPLGHLLRAKCHLESSIAQTICGAGTFKAGSARGFIRTNHWSRTRGSITSPPRWDLGTRISYGSSFMLRPASCTMKATSVEPLSTSRSLDQLPIMVQSLRDRAQCRGYPT